MKPYLKIIPLHQLGFKPKHFTYHQLQRIPEIILNGFENKEYATTAFFEVAQTFDRIWHQGLILKLTKLNLPTNLYNMLSSNITNCTFKEQIDTDIHEEHSIKAGVQLMLGPTLFNIFCRNILIPCKCQVAMYADDTSVIT